MKKTILLLIISLTVLAQSCKKYPEGPGVSLRTKKARMEGTWHIKQMSVNDENALEAYSFGAMQTSCSSIISYTEEVHIRSFDLSLKKEGGYIQRSIVETKSIDNSASFSACSAIYTTIVTTSTEAGSWDFNNDKTKLLLRNSNGETYIMTILELRHDHLHIVGHIDNEYYSMVFTQ